MCEPAKTARPCIALPHSPGARDPHGWGLLTDLAFYCTMPGAAQRNSRYHKTWEEFKSQAVDANDHELLGKINIVETYKNKLPGYVDILEEQSQYSILDTKVKYIFSTVHKFKGLECDTVRLLDDFNYLDIPHRRPSMASRETLGEDEFNLLYVALTRAKKNLIINDALFFLLTSGFISHSFERLSLSSSLNCGGCVKCGALTEPLKEKPAVASLTQQRVRVGVAMFREEGVLCGMCASSHRAVNSQVGGVKEGNLTDIFGELLPVAMWKVRSGVVEDGSHNFLQPLLLPLGTTREELQQHRDWIRTRSLTGSETELGKQEVEEFVTEKKQAESSTFEAEDDFPEEDDAWMFEVEEDGLLLAATYEDTEIKGDEDKEPVKKKPKGDNGGVIPNSLDSGERGAGRRGGRGRGGEGGSCFKCGEEGHMARECGGRGGQTCYKCGEEVRRGETIRNQYRAIVFRVISVASVRRKGQISVTTAWRKATSQGMISYGKDVDMETNMLENGLNFPAERGRASENLSLGNT